MSPTDTDLEPLLIETLRVKAAQVPEVIVSFDPDIVNLDTGGERRSRSRRLVAAAVVLMIVATAGLAIAFGDRDSAQPAGRPIAEPDARLVIEALPTLRFQADDYTTQAGVNEITFMSSGGTHRLVFADPALAGFALDASKPGVPSRGDVTLEAGRDYTIYCALPGHRAAGMEAVIHVRASGALPDPDTVPLTPTTTLSP
ncbi:MAG: plastocyanin/azurin family copper-binding protein [Acidimicrobiia bacterium]